ncbi:LOW QUALITY PROTEIN: hypothetical protein N5P37_011840 [Trichoderma harzianum]|nr:LOW QUALITY PROTEIN: hypothetical protein N5P37_011840 [Trichoderma harzianum]
MFPQCYYQRPPIAGGLNDLDEQTRYQYLFDWEPALHSISEELVVYPVFEKNLTIMYDQQIAQKDRQGAAFSSSKSYPLKNLDFIPALKNICSDLMQHIRRREDLPKLEQAVSVEESQHLSNSFQRTKKFMPTHSRSSAPDMPPFKKEFRLLSAPLDNLMDAFKKFPKRLS